MLNLLLPALILLAQPAPPAAEIPSEDVSAPAPPAAAGAAAQPPAQPAAPAAKAATAPATAPAAAGQELKPLSFLSQRLPFRWDQMIALAAEVDGLKLNSIFFNKRTLTLIKSAEFGTRAVVSVTNSAAATRVPGFAVAVFDAEDRLLGVASGGPKIGGVPAGQTETFNLSFSQVVDRIPKADHFYLTVELSN